MGAVFGSVYFPSMDILAVIGLQVTAEVRARGPGGPSEVGFSFPAVSIYNIGCSGKITVQNGSLYGER